MTSWCPSVAQPSVEHCQYPAPPSCLQPESIEELALAVPREVAASLKNAW